MRMSGPRVCAAVALAIKIAGAAAAEPRTSVSTASYVVPDVQLVRDDGKTVNLRAELDGKRSVVLSFIFTACTSVCPLTSATFVQLQHRLGADVHKVQLVSISIDPDADNAERLAEYARKFGARADWHFYTGTARASVEVQRAFDAYGGDKMRHAPDTYVRRPGSQSWVHLHGIASADELLAASGVADAPK